MTPWPEFFRDLFAVFNALFVRGDYGVRLRTQHPYLTSQLKTLSAAPIFDDERAALTLAKYETEIEDLLDADCDITPYSAEIRELMVACLQELRGEIPSKPPAIRADPTCQKITSFRTSRRKGTATPETA